MYFSFLQGKWNEKRSNKTNKNNESIKIGKYKAKWNNSEQQPVEIFKLDIITF